MNVPTGNMMRERDHNKHKDEAGPSSAAPTPRRLSSMPINGFLGTGLSARKVGIVVMVVIGLLTVGRWMVRE